MQLKLLYKTHQPRELCPMPPLEIQCSVSIPESEVLMIPQERTMLATVV